MKLAELSNDSFESKNVTFYILGESKHTDPSYIFSGGQVDAQPAGTTPLITPTSAASRRHLKKKRFHSLTRTHTMTQTMSYDHWRIVLWDWWRPVTWCAAELNVLVVPCDTLMSTGWQIRRSSTTLNLNHVLFSEPFQWHKSLRCYVYFREFSFHKFTWLNFFISST